MTFSRRRVAATVAVLMVAGAAAAGFALAWHPAIKPVRSPDRGTFAAATIARGAELAAIGDCAVCHTGATGRPYAGGRGVPTPFGVVYATNVTPDDETGIGGWSEAAFRRAMRDGIDRAGSHLYPVLPYPHFTRARDDDIAALYAFLMTRAPVRHTAPSNDLSFPFNERILIAGWNLLYLRPGPWLPDPAHDARWNRGFYLVEAVGHCGECHSARNALGAERGGPALGGGEAEDWYAPALQAGSPARRAWTEAALATYLRTGFQGEHGAAAGPMRAVTEELGSVPDADIQAIAAYVGSLMPKANDVPDTPSSRPDGDPQSAAMFAGACGSCHANDAPMTRGGIPPLSLGTGVNAPTPQGVIQIILNGIPWREGKPAPYMPAFASALTDAQVAAITTYVRTRYSDQPAWTDTLTAVGKARRGGGA